MSAQDIPDVHKRPLRRQPLFLSLRLDLLSSLLLMCSMIWVDVAWSCGVNSHLWITDSAICQLSESSRLRAFYEQQRYVDLTRLGSAFPDSGYAISHEYGEVAHWPPFIQSYIEDFQARFGVDDAEWSQEAWDEVAFILGVAAHGFEDELFDSQFLRWVEQEDGAGQDVIDSALDFLLIYEGHTELYPPGDFPSLGVTSALRRAGVEVSVEEVELGVARVRQVALRLSQNPAGLQTLVERNAPLIPWASRHYQSRDIKGSLGHEPRAVAALLEATYLRLRGERVAPLALSWIDPSEPRLLDRAGVEEVDESRWISLYFAVAARTEDIRSALTLKDEAGALIDYEWRGTRWGGGEGFTHLFELSPRVLSREQEHLTLELAGGVGLINGEVTSDAWVSQVHICPIDRCQPPELPEVQWGGKQRGCWVASSVDMMMDTLDHSVDSAQRDQGLEDVEDVTSPQRDMEITSPDQNVNQINDDSTEMNDGIAEMNRPSAGSGCQHTHTSSSLFLVCMMMLTLSFTSQRGQPRQSA